MAMPPPTPPSPPEGDATPDAGNPAQAAPPEVAPKPGRQTAKNTTETKKPATRARRTQTTKPKAATTAKSAAAPRPPAKPKAAAAPKSPPAPKAPTAPRKPTKPRSATARRADPRPRPRAAGLSVATVPSDQPVDTAATDPATRSRGRWWKTVAGGIGAIAAGAALFSLKGSSRRKAHQADGTDSSKSFAAGIADEGTIPDTPED